MRHDNINCESGWVSPKTFARLADYDQEYIRKLCRAGKIKYVRMENGRIRIPREEVDRFVAPSLTIDKFSPAATEEERYQRAKRIAASM